MRRLRGQSWACDARGATGTHGFTIVEMLVVIAVLAVLAGVLMPALSGVRAGSRSMTCQSQLRQMGLAAQQYANLYDAWPAAIRYESGEGQLLNVAWDWVSTFDGRIVRPGPLWSFTDHPDRVPQCPDYHGTTNFEGDPFTGYNYNTSHLGAEASFPSVGWTGIRRGVRPHACRRSSQCAMFGDGGRAGGTNKFMRSPENLEHHAPELVYAGAQAFRHVEATHVAFVDGHVGSVHQPHAGESSTDALLGVMGYPNNGFLSDDGAMYDPR